MRTLLLVVATAVALHQIPIRAAESISWGPEASGLRLGVAVAAASSTGQLRLAFQNVGTAFAELIDGIVHMASPVSCAHADFHSHLHIWLGFYELANPICRVGANGTWLMAGSDVPQPDLALRILPERGGQSRKEGNYFAGAPELVIEVGHTTTSKDAGAKLRLYERSGVREYIIVCPATKQITWRELVDGKYRENEPDAAGIFQSSVFPGLWLDTAALSASQNGG